ncbi:MAG: histidinol-phosphate transaminase [Thermodesulfovibrionales bacterium]|nr:histidinol-phosphate transaminase [Thermodesulfovibrionales bacterium]
MIEPLGYVSEIKPYVPGKPLKELERELGISESIKLASNENPLGPSKKAIDALRDYLLNGCELNRYPDGSGYYLKNALVDKLRILGSESENRKPKIEIDNIILGNGSNELIDIAVRTYMGTGDEAIMANPSFVVYSMAIRSVGGKAVEIPLTDHRHDLMKMADVITDKTKMVFIANPNNPTGTMNKRDEFKRFMDRIRDGILVVVDEAYYEYVSDNEYPETIRYFMDGRDILILRTFSKAYGLAGLRIGYGFARKDIINEMNKIREPFNSNTMAQVAAMHALEDEDHVKKSIEINEQGKQFLYRELDSMGLTYVPTEANFIYVSLDMQADEVYNALLRGGVIVRPVGPREIRVTIGLPEENKRFIEAIKTVISN